MANHPHILAVFEDAEMAEYFYMEVQKKLTDAIKRLLGVEQLNIWAKTPRVIEVADLRSAVKMIANFLGRVRRGTQMRMRNTPVSRHYPASIEMGLSRCSRCLRW